eukprot:scaffold9316_cov99-Skeletonema_menzelii.AAC.1
MLGSLQVDGGVPPRMKTTHQFERWRTNHSNSCVRASSLPSLIKSAVDIFLLVDVVRPPKVNAANPSVITILFFGRGGPPAR